VAPFKSYFKRNINKFKKNNSNKTNYLISERDVKYFIENIVLRSISTLNIFDEKINDSNVNLFIWCILYNRSKMAKVILPLAKVLIFLLSISITTKFIKYIISFF